MDKKCRNIKYLIHSYFDGDINDYDKDYLLNHIEKCNLCNRQFELIKNSINIFVKKESENEMIVDDDKLISVLNQRIFEQSNTLLKRFRNKLLYVFDSFVNLFRNKKLQFAFGLIIFLLLNTIITFVIVNRSNVNVKVIREFPMIYESDKTFYFYDKSELNFKVDKEKLKKDNKKDKDEKDIGEKMKKSGEINIKL